jgi:hypothetical protein
MYKVLAFENKALRKISEPSRDGVSGVWRILHDELPYYVYHTPINLLIR